MAVRLFLSKRPEYPDTKPVAVVLAVRRHRAHRLWVTTPVRVAPHHWSDTHERLKPTAPGAVELNAALLAIRAYAETLLVGGADDEAIRVGLKTRMGTAVPVVTPSLLTRFDAFAATRASSARPSTMQTYAALRGHLEAFAGAAAGTGAVGADFLGGFAAHLVGKGLANTTVNKLLKPAKAFAAFLEAHGEIAQRPDIKPLPTLRGETVYLTRDELDRLIALDLSGESPGYRAARDLFVAEAVTGQRFGDVAAMEWSALDAGRTVWVLSTQKTGKTTRLPLAGPLRAILVAREGQRTPLPVLSNQKANRYLKEVCRLAGFDSPVATQTLRGSVRQVETRPKWEVMTTHAGRKTFVTLMLQGGAATTDLLGITHDDLRTLRLYVGESEEQRRTQIDRTFGA